MRGTKFELPEPRVASHTDRLGLMLRIRTNTCLSLPSE
jgi:hypothetical protein